MRAFLSRTRGNKKSNVTTFEYILIIAMSVPIASAGVSTIITKL